MRAIWNSQCLKKRLSSRRKAFSGRGDVGMYEVAKISALTSVIMSKPFA